ncbi:SDR family NAD(P)-dependent oxidoreductase [Arthrobacter sp. NPDC056493]|uniref:SDR family NAD(P)-dependent oxidoreductase n=1 Tax=Arthrobacter sp. NPDC056493 TaxID=3345839 RepID=UPI0036727366
MSELNGKVAIVTGAAQGIGQGIATVLARHGAAVVVSDLDGEQAKLTAEQIVAAGGKAIGVQHDVTDLEAAEGLIARARQEFGQFDIWVNNAGVAMQKPYDEVTERDWDFINNINAKSTFFAAQTAGKALAGQGDGRIINVASFCGKQAIEEYAPYNASKFAAVAITQTLALELGPSGVTVNAVCPGVVKTRLWDGLDPEQWAMQEAKIPLRRGQTPEDIGEAVAFLASDRARNITGASIPVTGGLSIW